MNLFDENGKRKSWFAFKIEYNLNSTFYFQWLQLTDVIPEAWETMFKITLIIITPLRTITSCEKQCNTRVIVDASSRPLFSCVKLLQYKPRSTS